MRIHNKKNLQNSADENIVLIFIIFSWVTAHYLLRSYLLVWDYKRLNHNANHTKNGS